MRTRRVYWGERCNDAARSMRYRCLVYDGGNGDVNECGRATSNVNAFTCYYTLLRMISNTIVLQCPNSKLLLISISLFSPCKPFCWSYGHITCRIPSAKRLYVRAPFLLSKHSKHLGDLYIASHIQPAVGDGTSDLVVQNPL
jgi:hypothetical protein